MFAYSGSSPAGSSSKNSSMLIAALIVVETGVNRQHKTHAGVAEPITDHFGVFAALDQNAGVRVSQPIQIEIGQVSFLFSFGLLEKDTL
jgi:hypothetical protein